MHSGERLGSATGRRGDLRRGVEQLRRVSWRLLVCAITVGGVLAAPTPSALAEKKPLTLQALYGPTGRIDFEGSFESGMRWADARTYLQRRDGVLMRIDIESGASQPAYDAEALERALREAGWEARDARRAARRPDVITDAHDAGLVRGQGGWLHFRLPPQADDAVRLLPVAIPEGARNVRLDPAGRRAAFVHDNNLFVATPGEDAARQLTHDGGETLFNGILDWVYQEEVYGRGDWLAHWWSDDGRYIAYLQLDESPVPLHTIIHHSTTPPRHEVMHYPFAGDPNPLVRLGVVEAAPRGGGRPVTTWVDLSRYRPEDEILIVHVHWSPDGRLLFQVQDREQRWLDLCAADPQSGASRVLIRERSPAWVNRLEPPHWLADGSMIWQSERDGWRHLYHHAPDGALLRRLTGGDWDVQELHGVDEAGGWVYFSGARDGNVERHAYRAPLAGGAAQRLTEPGYSHAANFDPGFTRFFDTFSSVATPTRVHLRRADGELERVISANEMKHLDELILGRAELLRVPARDGYLMDALRILPADFDPAKSYPVLCKVYAGPGAPTVRNRWRGTRYMLDQYQAQQGMIIWYCDPRSASASGAISAWQAYGRLGASELSDIEDGLAWLAAQGGVDASRIGIQGGSYGGYIVCYALTRSRTFAAGVAAYPVTDWREYDSIYTERYMRLPRNNTSGYELSSSLVSAGGLHGALLLYHGMIDENVHVRNTLRLAGELQKAGRPFELMLYPEDRHGIGRGARHEREMTQRFIERHLLAPSGMEPADDAAGDAAQEGAEP